MKSHKFKLQIMENLKLCQLCESESFRIAFLTAGARFVVDK